jgi:hypothetical protein
MAAPLQAETERELWCHVASILLGLSKAENREHQWWTFIKSKLPTIAQAGFTALWLRDSQFFGCCFDSQGALKGITLRETRQPEFAATGRSLACSSGGDQKMFHNCFLANLVNSLKRMELPYGC